MAKDKPHTPSIPARWKKKIKTLSHSPILKIFHQNLKNNNESTFFYHPGSSKSRDPEKMPTLNKKILKLPSSSINPNKL